MVDAGFPQFNNFVRLTQVNYNLPDNTYTSINGGYFEVEVAGNYFFIGQGSMFEVLQ